MYVDFITKLETIEQAIADLSAEDRKKLRAFLDELEADFWDTQIKADANAGKLNWLAEAALADHAAD